MGAGGDSQPFTKIILRDGDRQVPEDFLVLDGGFTVKSDGTNKVWNCRERRLIASCIIRPTEKVDLEVSARSTAPVRDGVTRRSVLG